MHYQIIDAFASAPFTGNPAAVLPLTEILPDTFLQTITHEFTLPEPALPPPTPHPSSPPPPTNPTSISSAASSPQTPASPKTPSPAPPTAPSPPTGPPNSTARRLSPTNSLLVPASSTSNSNSRASLSPAKPSPP